MAVLRKQKQSNYTVIDNSIFKNKQLSLKAKGLLCLMLSLPDNWEYSVNGLTALSTDGISSVRSALEELQKSGYFKRRRLHENGRLAGVEYIVSETPMCENLILENQTQENQILENQPQLNTNTNKVKKESNKDIYSDVPDDVKDLFMEWVDMRKSIRKPVRTKGTVTRAVNELNRLSQDTQERRKIIEKAIDRNWLGFYPLDDKKPVKSANTPPEPPRYPEFVPDEKVDAVPMPDEVRKKMFRYEKELGV